MIKTSEELELLAENDYTFYSKLTMPIVEKMKVIREKSGNERARVRGTLHFVRELKDFFPGFNKTHYFTAASSMAESYLEEIKLGNY